MTPPKSTRSGEEMESKSGVKTPYDVAYKWATHHPDGNYNTLEDLEEAIRSYAREMYEAGRKEVADYMMEDFNSMSPFDWMKKDLVTEILNLLLPPFLASTREGE